MKKTYIKPELEAVRFIEEEALMSPVVDDEIIEGDMTVSQIEDGWKQ